MTQQETTFRVSVIAKRGQYINWFENCCEEVMAIQEQTNGRFRNIFKEIHGYDYYPHYVEFTNQAEATMFILKWS